MHKIFIFAKIFIIKIIVFIIVFQSQSVITAADIFYYKKFIIRNICKNIKQNFYNNNQCSNLIKKDNIFLIL